MLLPLKGKILALDIGMSTTGLAISDSSQQVAFIRDEIRHKDSRELSEYINRLVIAEGIVGFVVGHPIDMQGNETEQTRYVEQIIIELNLEPHFKIDERRTSLEAESIKQHKMSKVDSESAYILLNNYINLKNSSHA